MGISIWQILIVVVLVVMLFGRGKISDLMGDVAKGITSFKKGLKEDDSEKAEDITPVVEGEKVKEKEDK
ncbi:MAG: twin-arginine translocase TatA/TatE family subunit [Sphingomonadales bacterium]|nr:twin-arginine translocase TatA/TatE family subunit [Sphingomonadales bacterium]